MNKILLLIGWFCLIGSACIGQAVPKRPNVLVIVADDLNDNISGLGEEIQAFTPNMDRLRDEAVSFTNAHSNVPLCNPSRASFWSGLYPHTTGFFGYDQQENTWWTFPVLKDATMLFTHFQRNGYNVHGTGKIYHRSIGAKRVIDSRRYGIEPSFGPFAYNGNVRVAHPGLKEPYRSSFALRSFAPLSDVPVIAADPEEGIPGYHGWWDQGESFRYADEDDRDLMVDERSAEWAVDVLQQDHSEPFFLTVGFMRPHRPQVAPKKYFDLYPPESISLPPYLKDDLSDVPEVLWKDIENMEKNKGFGDFQDLMAAYEGEKGWKLWLQSYLACVSFVDAQLGKVLDALNQSPYKDNTIVIFTSDHGYHMGEKDYMFKLSVWEESTRVPLIIRVPGLTDQQKEVTHPVSLIDLYPTVTDLTGISMHPNKSKGGPELDGYSLRPFLEDPDDAEWDGPSVALSVIYGSRKPEDHLALNEPGKPERQHFTVRSERYKYTLTNTGQEELYDIANDPHEWKNLAGNPQYDSVKSELNYKLLNLTGRK